MKKKVLQENMKKTVEKVRTENPVCGSVTNTVTVEFVANAQIAIGGSAAVVYLDEDAINLGRLGKTFYINMGTLMPSHGKFVPIICRRFAEEKIPWVLDPVGVDSSQIHRDLLMMMKEYRPKVIRGNASEIIGVAKMWDLISDKFSGVRGVDATVDVASAREAAIRLARYIGGAVAASGDVDLITDGHVVVYSYGGSHFMEKITGAGCALGGVCGVYLTCADPLTATVTGHHIFNLAAALAEAESSGPGTFRSNFLDRLYSVSAEDVATVEIKIEEA